MAWYDDANGWVATKYNVLFSAVSDAEASAPTEQVIEAYQKQLEILKMVAYDVLDWQRAVARRDILQTNIDAEHVSPETIATAQAEIQKLGVEIAYIELKTKLNQMLYKVTI